jgi:hypothetical protein
MSDEPTNCIMSVYLCSQPDSQRGTYLEPDIKIISAWVNSIKKEGLQIVLFHDCFNEQQIEDNKYIKFVRVIMPADTNAYFYRFNLYADYLEQFKSHFKNVFFTDCTDVVLLQNPFEHPAYSPHKIYVGDEPNTIGCVWMKDEASILIEAWPNYAAFEILHAKSLLLNPGIIGGNTNIVFPFIKDMASLCMQLKHLANTDMALFNYLAYHPKYKDLITHGSQVNTIYKMYETNDLFSWFAHK